MSGELASPVVVAFPLRGEGCVAVGASSARSVIAVFTARDGWVNVRCVTGIRR